MLKNFINSTLEQYSGNSYNSKNSDSSGNSDNTDNTDNKDNYKCDNITETFKLPIYYQPGKKLINNYLIDDLELTSTKDNSNNSMYDYIFNPNDNFSKRIANVWSEYYVSDKLFLEDSKRLYKRYSKLLDNDSEENKENNENIENIENKENKENMKNIEEIWSSIKNDDSFLMRYQYLEWSILQPLNCSAPFLFLLSIYTLSSPVFSFITPIFFLILPYLLLKSQKVNITWSKYYEILKQMIKRNSLGKVLMDFNSTSLNEKGYFLMTIAIYFYQMYQNAMVCYNFYKNSKLINYKLTTIHNFIKNNIKKTDNLLSYTNNLTTYNDFNKTTLKHRNNLEKFNKYIADLLPLSMKPTEILKIGGKMKVFYLLYTREDFSKSLNYAFGISGYLSNIENLQKQINNNNLNYVRFAKSTKFIKACYPPLINQKKNIKNTYKLNKNYLITGPNAAGKTTFIKTSLLNILFSQQLGVGFFRKGFLKPYDYLHCYINIPDTSGRDSLFQAEARRCKDILEVVSSNQKARHFCVFDELYSGTNPYEATAAAYGYLEHLSKMKNIQFILTTHYINLCEDLNKNKQIQNYHMDTVVKPDKQIEYKYLLTKGISGIKGGINVLLDLNYPKNITDIAEKYLIDSK